MTLQLRWDSTCQPALSTQAYQHYLQCSSSSLDMARRLVLMIRQGNRSLPLLHTVPYLLGHQYKRSQLDTQCRMA